ncbi:MAG: alpha/beta hydrolase [Deltaproteobacteria bacterium]|nr:alpha/beta hydrolase [Deltaproteobacteria bacterium]
MSQKTLVGQLRGATRLAVDATRGVTKLVETMHHTIASGPAVLGTPLEGVTKLLTAPTYGAVLGVTSAMGAGLDLALATLEPLLDRAGAERGALLAALNGVMGDYLAQTGNPLAIEMRLCSQGAALELTPEALSACVPEGTRLLVLVHGSSTDDAAWTRAGHDHGAALAVDRGLVPLYLRYNSGLHVSQNGRAFALLLERLVAAWPRPVEELVLLGHSRGGLVSRSACLVAEAEGHRWRSRLHALVTLGTPHHGAPLERGGHWGQALLGISRYSAPFAVLGKLRSAGITDLRYGNVLDAHWQGRDRFGHGGDPRGALHLPAGVDCYAVAGTRATALRDSLPGDGMVPVDSALGRHEDPARSLDFAQTHRWIALGTSHLNLLSSRHVYATLRDWL